MELVGHPEQAEVVVVQVEQHVAVDGRLLEDGDVPGRVGVWLIVNFFKYLRVLGWRALELVFGCVHHVHS